MTPQKLSKNKKYMERSRGGGSKKQVGNIQYFFNSKKPARWGRIRFLGGVRSQMNWQEKKAEIIFQLPDIYSKYTTEENK